MLEAARAAVNATARTRSQRPLLVGVTRLTSDADATTRRIVQLARLARATRLDGVVAPPSAVAAVRRACGPRFVIVTPGIRPAGERPADDQKRTVDVAQAFANGADYIVVGRPIRQASEPKAAAEAIQRTIAGIFPR